MVLTGAKIRTIFQSSKHFIKKSADSRSHPHLRLKYSNRLAALLSIGPSHAVILYASCSLSRGGLREV